MSTFRTISVIVTPGVVREGMTSRRGIMDRRSGISGSGITDAQIHNYQ